MYVCICQAVTDGHIRHAVRNGILTFEQLRLELNVAQCCGRCHDHARQVFHEALAEQFPAMPIRTILPGSAAA